MNVKTYRLSQDTASDQANLVRRRAAVQLAITVVGVAAIAFVVNREILNNPPVFITMGAIILFLIVKTGFSLRKVDSAVERQFQTYLLSIYEDRIHREVEGFPDVEIRKNEIIKIEEDAAKGFHVRSSAERLFIPRSLIGYEDVLQELSTIQPVRKAGLGFRIPTALSSGAVILFFIVFAAAHSVLTVLITGVPLAVFMLWGAFYLYKSQTLPQKSRRLGLWLILPWMGVVGKILVVLIGAA